ncbi:A/G-specific adenine glycosylase [Cytophagales bacterium RKSG123]|nr:A/G-specific adenine glycosylase [Xanthovirga aplysinae]
MNWYKDHKRDLPWRHTNNPYKIWLSEIILQQTRVKQGLPYYQRFIEKFPNVQSLAQAEEEEVLRLWQGLGYYSRARNLHACAQMITKEYEGTFPTNYEELLKLKGVGKYTAAAIASFAFKQDVPVVDGNVFRLLSRYFGITEDIAIPKSFKSFFELGQKLIPKKEPDIYNQAVMEFGAIQCTPKNPDCKNCNLADSCFANSNQRQEELPVKTKKVKVRDRYFHYFVIKLKDQLIMKKRGRNDIWQGLYDFFLIEENSFQSPDQWENKNILSLLAQPEVELQNESKIYKHLLTHQRIYAKFFEIEIKDQFVINKQLKSSGLDFFNFNEIKNLPKSILISNYLDEKVF